MKTENGLRWPMFGLTAKTTDELRELVASIHPRPWRVKYTVSVCFETTNKPKEVIETKTTEEPFTQP